MDEIRHDSPLDARHSGMRTGGPSFPLRHRLLRLAFGVTWLLLARWTPPALHGWRCLILRMFGACIGRHVRFYGSANVWYPPNLRVDEGAVIAPHVTLYCMDEMVIGPNAVVSQGAHLCGGSHDIDDPYFQLVTRPIHVERHAWICAEAFVGPGVTVGMGAVLGARAVTMSDLAPLGVYVGNTARRIRWRSPLALTGVGRGARPRLLVVRWAKRRLQQP